MTDAAIAERLQTCVADFVRARQSGDDEELNAFGRDWTILCDTIETAQSDGVLTPATIRLAHAASQAISSLARRFSELDSTTGELHDELMTATTTILQHEEDPSRESPEPTESSRTTELPFTYVRPLLQFILDNISCPYPTADEKQDLLDDVYAAGWASCSLKKLDDWLGNTRTKMGYTALLKTTAIGDDRDLLEDYVRRVLGDSCDDDDGDDIIADIPQSVVRLIEDMQQWVLDQLAVKAAKTQTSAWAHDILGLVDRVNTSDEEYAQSDARDDSPGFTFDSECDVDSDDETQYSDSDSYTSDTDVEAWVDEPLRGIIGTKRKYSGLQGLGYPISSPLSRSSSSSSLSSRGHSIWSRRSSSGSTSASSVDWEQEQREENDRPTKRRRSSVELPPHDPSSPTPCPLEDKPSQPSHIDASSSDSLPHETISPCSSSSPPSAQSPEPIPFTSNALFPAESPALVAAGSMQKRKRAASDDEDARPVVSKRRRHSASPPSIPMQHFTALGIIGHLPWNMSPCASSAVELELEAYALDSSPFAHGVAPEPLDDADEEEKEEEEDEEDHVYDGLVDYSNERMLEEVVEDGTPGTFTWSEMQLHVLDSILSYGARPTPAATATRNVPLSSPQEFRLDLPSLDDDDLAYLLNIAAGPSMPSPAEVISPPLPSMNGQTFDLDLDVKPPLPESDVDNFVRLLQGWTSASAACPIRLEEPAPFADAEVDKWAVDFLARAPADLMTH